MSVICGKKKIKKFRRKEEIPSFLVGLSKPESPTIPPSQTLKDNYSGPIFFGGCHQIHPIPHSVYLGPSHAIQYTAESKENIFQDMFLPKTNIVKNYTPKKSLRLAGRKCKKEFIDLYTHRCPGQRKVIVHEVSPPIIDLGKTVSEIEDEARREIPLYRFRRDSSRSFETEYDILTMSDMRERKLPFMSNQERSAHAHFSKEFFSVRMIGPNIPEAITITKIPSKRKRVSDMDLLLSSRGKVGSEKDNKLDTKLEPDSSAHEESEMFEEELPNAEKIEKEEEAGMKKEDVSEKNEIEEEEEKTSIKQEEEKEEQKEQEENEEQKEEQQEEQQEELQEEQKEEQEEEQQEEHKKESEINMEVDE